MKTITNFFVLQAHSPLLKEIECTYTQRLLRFVTARSGTGGIIICVLEGDPCSHTSLVFLLPMPSIKVSFFSFSFCKDSLKKAHGHHVLSALSKQRSEHAQQQRLPGERLNINKRTSLLTKLHGSLVLPRGGDAQLCNPHSRVALNSFAVEPSRTAASAAGSSAESGANAPVHVPSSFFFFFFRARGRLRQGVLQESVPLSAARGATLLPEPPSRCESRTTLLARRMLGADTRPSRVVYACRLAPSYRKVTSFNNRRQRMKSPGRADAT